MPGLTHRYRDKALFLPLNSCPVYCRFCTRSYAIGGDTNAVGKLEARPGLARWEKAFAYIESRPELEDIVISGGDTYNLKAEHIRLIGERLLAMPNIRRIRYVRKCNRPPRRLSGYSCRSNVRVRMLCTISYLCRSSEVAYRISGQTVAGNSPDVFGPVTMP